MFSKIKENIVGILAAVAALLFALFKYEQGKKEEAESKVINAEHDKRDAVLATRQEGLQERIAEEVSKTEEAKAKDVSIAELEETLKKI